MASEFSRPSFQKFPLGGPLNWSISQAAGDDQLGDMPEWKLEDLYPSLDAPELDQDIKKLQSDAKTFHGSYQGKLIDIVDDGAGGGDLARIIREYEALQDLAGRIGSFAGLLYAGDTSNPDRAKFYGDIQEKLTEISSSLLFFSLELNRLEDSVVDACCVNPDLQVYRPWIDDLRKEKPYQLEDELEQLFHEKSVTSRGAWNRLFNETITSLKFEVGGESLSLEPTLNGLLESDPEKRRQAAEALADVFQSNLRLFTLITNTLAKDKEISDRWRGFGDVADERHLSNRVEGTVVDALVRAVAEKYPAIPHRYYALKARWLGKDKLAHWDRNAPLPHQSSKVIPWSDAQNIVLDAYSGFDPQMSDIASEFFKSGWIDAPVRSGKSPGAFSHPTVPSAHPYILLNYQGKPRDVMTLAHELGHGVHQVLANEQGALMAPTPLTLAETASVFGEMLTFKELLSRTTNPRERKALLASKVEDMINTVARQIAFYQFERNIHTERRSGELTSEKIGEIWLDVQRESLGPSVRLEAGYETFWSYIPHFIHSPFYVYAYAFGECLVNSLYAVYENADEGFVDKYFSMLKAGGSKNYHELLHPFGLNAREPDFWSMGLSVIERMIDDLEAMED